ncbi:P-loop containing nucleoside triphosphate hydrolase protein [Stachybotrys elegans]|uniref:P-loop containing nucleoside triphosphate hydrolase protein n=1 Tax=Stachybotrys elegans TaxID=80388 RepID=A0A8K0SLT7_9HYPO|nr:P-loop containing nucleoside triphosphate hydrolase protein [Stachybotrys elegans]
MSRRPPRPGSALHKYQERSWEESAPEDIDNSTSTSAELKFALVVRHERRIGDVLKLHSIRIQSPVIKAALGPVFEDYPSINPNLKKLEFSAPFHMFFYRWMEFVNARPSDIEENKMSRAHYDLLFRIIHAEMSPILEHVSDLVKNKVISHDYLWTLFEPGTEVYSKIDGKDRLCQLSGGRYTEVCPGVIVYCLSCRHVDSDGTKFGFGYLHPQISDIREKLLARGRKFEALHGCHNKAYTGRYIIRKPPQGLPPICKGDTEQAARTAHGRIMVDCASYQRYNGLYDDYLEPLHSRMGSSALGSLWSVVPNVDDNSDEEMAYTPPMMRWLKKMVADARRQANKFQTQDKSSEGKTLSDQQCMLASPMVKGYCLNTKHWAQFNVDSVADIVWNDQAFDRLVLPHDYKSAVWAFVHAQLTKVDEFDDVIEGKGKGMIMLLSGEPGTGKTLTSESVSEAMRKPLYSMSAGELGLTAEEVEQNLSRVLELSKAWSAVLLSDECDVFLEKRSSSDLHRNKLVSAFLRLLEYYQGVMFLTTNRASSFDPAFESRIDLTLHYPDLDLASRISIWKTFVQPGSDKTSIKESDIDVLAKEAMNGRQIKNVVKTSRLLASRTNSRLQLEHVKTVLRIKRGQRAYQVDNYV